MNTISPARTNRIRVGVAQLNPTVGDITGNTRAIIAAVTTAADDGADLVVAGELAISGYPPDDLLARPAFVAAQRAAVDQIAAAIPADVVAVVGHAEPVTTRHDTVDSVGRVLHNAASVLAGGRVVATVAKRLLPDYGPFDETRHFAPGHKLTTTVEVGDVTVGVAVCEDLWTPVVANELAAAGAQLIVVPNASPYELTKPAERASLVSERAAATGIPLVYVNIVGGQDELVFDGGSLVADATGKIIWTARRWVESVSTVDVAVTEAIADPTVKLARNVVARPRPLHPNEPTGPTEQTRTSTVADVAAVATGIAGAAAAPGHGDTWDAAACADVWAALTVATGDYFAKSGFRTAVLGLSGGIDSAVAAAVAVDALGADNVRGVAMPGPYSSPGSITDAQALAAQLGIRFDVVPITGMYDATVTALHDNNVFTGTSTDVTEENFQARLRGLVLMGVANKFGGLVISTGNRSEMAVGYTTLYGDMAGGFCVLGDVPKTGVYALARWRNTTAVNGGPAAPIPDPTITKPPSAELAEDQVDSDSLPEYPILDMILAAYIDADMDPAQIAETTGTTPALVENVCTLVDRAEFKRRQAPPCPKVGPRSFGRTRRLPIVSAWKPFAGPATGGADDVASTAALSA